MRRHRLNKKWQRSYRQKNLQCPEKIEFRLKSPDLRLSQGIAAIGIKCRIDWCIRQAQQWVRWHRMNEKRRQQSDRMYSPRHKKSNCDSSRRIYASPKTLPQLASNAASIDVSDRCNSRWEDIEWTKSDGDTGHTSTYLSTKNCLATQVAGSTPFRCCFGKPYPVPYRLMYRTHIEIDENESKDEERATPPPSWRLTNFAKKKPNFATSRKDNASPTLPDAIFIFWDRWVAE